MQTFLPHKKFSDCAKELDSKRLNKQILEGYQILNILLGNSESKAWRNHPAVLMWKNNEGSLVFYVKTMIREAKRRGIKTDKNSQNIHRLLLQQNRRIPLQYPSWYKDSRIDLVVETHRANLYKKDPIFYAHFSDSVESNNNKPCCPNRKEPCKYYWPTHVS
jgi:hypothetical protein